MALRINLYHEVLRAKRQEQFDPLKLSLLALIIVALIMASYYGVQLKRTSDVRSVFSAQKAEFDKLEPKVKEAEKREVELTKQIDLAEKLAKRMEKRIYWAPLFESVMLSVPSNVQLTRLNCDSNREKGGVSAISIEGIAADVEPRAVAESLRKAIVAKVAAKYPGAAATFKNLDDSTDHPVLDGRRVSAVLFTINVTFKAEADPAPAPAPSKRIAKNEVPTP